MEVQWIISVFLGIGLAAATGFRVFLPLLILSICTRLDVFSLAENWQWIASTPALILLITASFLEIAAYYIPWFDNLLDSIAVPLAGIAGTVVMIATLGDVAPWITWSLAIIAGGGTAAVIAGTTSTVRATSTLTTAGIANPIVSTIENIISTLLSILAIFVPILAGALVFVIIYFLIRFYKRFNRKEIQ